MKGLEKNRMKRDGQTNRHHDSMMESAQWADSMKKDCQRGQQDLKTTAGKGNSSRAGRQKQDKKRTAGQEDDSREGWSQQDTKRTAGQEHQRRARRQSRSARGQPDRKTTAGQEDSNRKERP